MLFDGHAAPILACCVLTFPRIMERLLVAGDGSVAKTHDEMFVELSNVHVCQCVELLRGALIPERIVDRDHLHPSFSMVHNARHQHFTHRCCLCQ